MLRLGAFLCEDLVQDREDALVMLEDLPLAAGLIIPDDLQSLVNVAGDLEPLADGLGVELRAREDLRIGM
jgi:hypothetical protein